MSKTETKEISQKIEYDFQQTIVGKRAAMMMSNTSEIKTIMIKPRKWNTLPTNIDGHFWVEDTDGNIINDITIQAHKDRAREKNEELIYYYANPQDEERYIAEKYETIVNRNIRNHMNAKLYYAQLEMEDMSSFDCFQASTLTAYKTGGKIRFGFIGSLNRYGRIYWLFGHPENTYSDFDADPNTTKSQLKNSHDTHISNHPQLLARKGEAREKELMLIAMEQEKEQKRCAMELEKKKRDAEKAEQELYAMLDKEEEEKKKKKGKK